MCCRVPTLSPPWPSPFCATRLSCPSTASWTGQRCRPTATLHLYSHSFIYVTESALCCICLLTCLPDLLRRGCRTSRMSASLSASCFTWSLLCSATSPSTVSRQGHTSLRNRNDVKKQFTPKKLFSRLPPMQSIHLLQICSPRGWIDTVWWCS